jgi:hypothetical protein
MTYGSERRCTKMAMRERKQVVETGQLGKDSQDRTVRTEQRR